ncbi:MAG TPA: dihydropteroate synthase [Candidatus Thermoplasmatota archaeon]|nr:dihydropteroate synthase [Candidatus Thermoplasmatota archaeon]
MASPELRLHGGGRVALPAGRPLVMGILNATPDSFSDGGDLLAADGTVHAQQVRRRARELAEAGADLLDLGGESTRPGHAPVPEASELLRVLRVLPLVGEAAPQVPVSVDTRRAAVAHAALQAGAGFVNDVSGLSDPGMAAIVREAGCSIVLMRSQPIHGDLLQGCRQQLRDLVGVARGAGIPAGALVVDPGLGFGDPPGGDPAANLALLRGAPVYGDGLPVLVGASRKRFLGTLTGIQAARGRALPSAVAAVLAAQAGASILRVHDVAETVQALRVAGLRDPPGPGRA